MNVWTKRGVDIVAPTDAAGNPRKVINGEMQTWMTEVERLFNTGAFNSVDAVGLYADRSTFDGEAEGFVYVSIDGDGAGSSSAVVFIKESAASGDWSPPVPFQGDKGWSPMFRAASDGARRVLEVYDWVGGDGEKPATVGFVGAAGLTPNIAEAIDIRGPQGVSGTGLSWSFDDGTADADPGAGKLRADAADLSVATELFVSKTSAGGDLLASFLAGLTNSTSTHKGYLIVTDPSTASQATFDVTGTTDAAGYVKLAVSGHSGALAFADAALLSVVFSRTGNAGDLNGVNPGTAGLDVLEAETKEEARQALAWIYPAVEAYGPLTETATFEAAAADAAAKGLSFVTVAAASISLAGTADMQGVGIIGNGTVISATTKFDNAGEIRGCNANGFSTDILTRDVSGAPNSVSPKLLVCALADSRLYLLSRNARGNYVRHELRYDVFASGANDAGILSQVWRPTTATLCRKVFAYKRTSSALTGTWGSSTQTNFGQIFGPNVTGGYAFWYRSSNTSGGTIEFEVEAERIGQKCNVAFYGTTGASEDVTISVNGVAVQTITTRTATIDLVLCEVSLTAKGTNTITIMNNQAMNVNVIGVNAVELKDFAGEEVDNYAYGMIGSREYLSSQGANDYAFVTADAGTYFGSYHGGETKLSEPVLMVDGDPVAIPSTANEFVIGGAIALFQHTELAAGVHSLECRRTDEFVGDGYYRLSCQMSGSALVKRAFTAMSAASTSFTEMLHPFHHLDDGSDLDIGRVDTVVLRAPLSPSGGYDLRTRYTLFPVGGEHGANLKGGYIAFSAGTYNKLYYGPTLESAVTLNQIAFSTERWFQ